MAQLPSQNAARWLCLITIILTSRYHSYSNIAENIVQSRLGNSYSGNDPDHSVQNNMILSNDVNSKNDFNRRREIIHQHKELDTHTNIGRNSNRAKRKVTVIAIDTVKVIQNLLNVPKEVNYQTVSYRTNTLC